MIDRGRKPIVLGHKEPAVLELFQLHILNNFHVLDHPHVNRSHLALYWYHEVLRTAFLELEVMDLARLQLT